MPLHRAIQPKQRIGRAFAGMMRAELPAGGARQVSKPVFTLGQPIKIALFQVTGLERFMFNSASHGLKNCASVKGERLFLRVKDL